MNKRIVFGGLSVVSIIGFLTWAFSADGAIPVRTVTAERGSLYSSVTVTGRVVSDREVVVSAEVAGKVDAVKVKEGDTVRAGQVLVRLNEREAKERLMKAEAEWRRARQAGLRATQIQQRIESLWEIGGESRQALENAQAEQQEAMAQERAAQSEVNIARLNLEKTRIVAPLAGIITHKNVNVDQWVLAGAPLLTLMDPMQREIEVKVDAGDSSLIQTGQKAEVSSDAFPGIRWTEQVIRLAPAVQKEGATNSFNVRLTLAGEAPALRFGQQVDVKILTAFRQETVKLPFAAIISQDNKSVVATIRDGGVYFLPVVTGIEDLTHTEILQGLAPGQVVILPEGKELKPGERVVPMSPAP